MDVNTTHTSLQQAKNSLHHTGHSQQVLQPSISTRIQAHIGNLFPDMSRLSAQDRMAIATGIIVIEESARLSMSMAIKAELPLERIVQAALLGATVGFAVSMAGFKYGRFSRDVSESQYYNILRTGNAAQRRLAFVGYNLLQPGAQMLATIFAGVKLAEQAAKYAISRVPSEQVNASVAYGNMQANSTVIGLGIFAAAVLIPLCTAIFFSTFDPRLPGE